MKEFKQAIFDRYSMDCVINAIFTSAVKLGFSIAIWRLPESNEIHLLVSFKDFEEKHPSQFNLNQGFIITPFDCSHKIIIIGDDDFKLILNNDEYRFELRDCDEAKIFTRLILSSLENKQSDNVYYSTAFTQDFSKSNDKKSFLDFIHEGIKEINLQHLKKIVALRTSTIALQKTFSIFSLYQSLCTHYPNAFVSIISHPNVGTWLSASPELLFKINHNSGLTETVSLAGTKKKPNCSNFSQWTNKEFYEQALVTEFITETIKRHGIIDYQLSNQQTYQIGNICHLKTEIKFNLKQKNTLIDVNELVFDLHPTPAICGIPKDSAFEFLRQHEAIDRELYGGFLGPVNYDGETNLFVNIRCMQLLKDKAIIYAGAGITYDSDPELEWEETNLKCEMMLNIIREYFT